MCDYVIIYVGIINVDHTSDEAPDDVTNMTHQGRGRLMHHGYPWATRGWGGGGGTV